MQENNNQGGLHDVLSQETEHKTAGTAQSSMWNFSDDSQIKDETDKGENEQKADKKNKPSDDILKASAETATASLDAVIDMGGSLALNVRFKNKFKDDELKQAKELADKATENLNPDQTALAAKYKREYEKLQSKLQQLPFDTKENDRLVKIWYNYFKTTGKEISPDFLLYLGLGSILIDKAIIVFGE